MVEKTWKNRPSVVYKNEKHHLNIYIHLYKTPNTEHYLSFCNIYVQSNIYIIYILISSSSYIKRKLCVLHYNLKFIYINTSVSVGIVLWSCVCVCVEVFLLAWLLYCNIQHIYTFLFRFEKRSSFAIKSRK